MKQIGSPKGEEDSKGSKTKSHVVERRVKSELQSLESHENNIQETVDYIERYQKMEPKNRFEGFYFRCLRWWARDYQSGLQHDRNNMYLSGRLSLVSGMIFIISIAILSSVAVAVLSGLVACLSLLMYSIYGDAVDEAEKREVFG